MNNESGLKFIDISSEQYRTYHYESGHERTIKLPTHLNVSDSGGHRLLDNSGISHYIKPEWVYISWKAKPGCPNFIK